MDLLYTAHVPPGPGPFPAIIALHGWGASAHDLIGLAPLLHHGRALMLCPQASTTLRVGPGGYGWFPLRLGGPLHIDALESAVVELDSFRSSSTAERPSSSLRSEKAELGWLWNELIVRDREVRLVAAPVDPVPVALDVVDEERYDDHGRMDDRHRLLDAQDDLVGAPSRRWPH